MVTYYTIQWDGEAKDCFSDFRDKHIKDPACKKGMQILMYWLTEIGNKFGAKDYYFRPESYRGGDAKELPPPAKLQPSTNLRLYCIRINNHSVILLSGGKKTTRIAQDCPNVNPAFIEANKIEKAIRELIQNNEIQIDDNERLSYDHNLKLEIK